ncbi:oxygen-evolving enhancer protein 3-1, chloroplastic-like [Canna indica]|uniref:Oxygen-evolving enhancer protein 3-1, chloroplastic-like n=1 Tax=Canna indica TaxID=4628 RepID=A0AAQ3L161_9LILI|nr:oxygen-evolving enhancer protein 3-1, chloroplastic-like [Canna indica]
MDARDGCKVYVSMSYWLLTYPNLARADKESDSSLQINHPRPSLSFLRRSELVVSNMASMAGFCGSSQAVLEGSLQLSGTSRLAAPGANRAPIARSGFVVRAQQQGPAEGQSGRRAVLGLVAAGLAGGSFVKVVLADAKSIKVGPPPPPSGGLPGTLNSDEARDFDLPLKERFYLQALPPTEAAARAKESAKDILNVKGLIDKKEWPYVMNDLRLKAGYLRFDLNTIIAAKPKEEKKPLKELTGKLFAAIDELDHAAKIKSSSEAEKYYATTKSILGDVLAKIG